MQSKCYKEDGSALMNTNNRQQQNNNRRRGRNNNNNNRQQNNNRSGFDYQNQIDNRARGNAAQMLEKYKKLAQDAQFNGDRVNAEYHLQFADHYFRVLADFRGRQEARQEQQGERRPRDDARDDNRDDRDDWQNDNRTPNYDRSPNYDDPPSSGNDEAEDASDEESNVSEQRDIRARRPERSERHDRSERPERSERPANNRNAHRGPRRHHSEDVDDAPAGLDLAVLPPSIAMSSGEDDAAEKPARKPRARRVKPVGGDETATAAE
jgi:hypothetical protein